MSENNEQYQSQYWLDIEVDRILEKMPEGEIVVASGISPSASYHIGHYPEVLMAEALAWGLRQKRREVRHVHIVDNMDPLRKRYDFLPEEYERYVGWPICLIPNPYGEGSYADYFFEQFRQYFEPMGIAPDEIMRSYEDLYRSGKMAPQIESVLKQLDEVKRIFAEFEREVPDHWTPVQVRGSDNVFTNARPDTWDQDAKTIEGVSYENGGVKLNWRLDWPARWAVLGVNVEPFNVHEHGAAGGSYATGVEFARRIFGIGPPIPGARYGNIHLAGDPKKMSASKGNLITPEEALEIIPPSILRYFIVKSRPEKPRDFDPQDKLINLIDEYKQAAAAVKDGQEYEFSEAYRFADVGDRLTEVPFAHLAAVYQAAQGDVERTVEILARTGYEVDRDALAEELGYVAFWLERYASDNIRFLLQADLPDVSGLSDKQTAFLAGLAEKIAKEEQLEADWVHQTIHTLKDEHGLGAREAFQALYTVLLGKTSGPKAGWYLTTIDKNWLVRRLRLEA